MTIVLVAREIAPDIDVELLQMRRTLAPEILVRCLVDGRGYVKGIGHLEQRQQHRHQQLPLAIVAHQIANHIGLILIVIAFPAAMRIGIHWRRRRRLCGRGYGRWLAGCVVHGAQRNCKRYRER